MIDDVSAWMFGLINGIGSVATAIGIFFVYMQTKVAAGGLNIANANLTVANNQLAETQKQTRQTQMQIDNTFKPWLGNVSLSVNGQSIAARIRNYGKLPAALVRIRYDRQNAKITREGLRSVAPTLRFDRIIIYPDQVREIDPDKGVKGVSILATLPRYMGILLEFEYPYQNNDSYGIIWEGSVNNDYIIIDEWFGDGS